jgi:anti-anti-sigma factor
LTIEERHAADVTILALTGKMLLDDGDLAFGKRIHELVERGLVKVVLDLRGVTYIDSSGVGMLVAKTLKGKGGGIKLLRLSRCAESLLGMLKLLTQSCGGPFCQTSCGSPLHTSSKKERNALEARGAVAVSGCAQAPLH